MKVVVVMVTVSVAVLGSTGCGTSHSNDAATGTLRVHIGLYGGPVAPDGGQALNNSPASGETVTAASVSGHKFSAVTASNGDAVLHLASGRYTVFSTFCGPQNETVSLRPGQVKRIQISCPVP